MAAPSYTTDLVTLAIGSLTVDAGTWDESSDAGWDTAGTMVDDANLYYNGTACVSAQYTKDGSGSGTTGPGTIMYVHTGAFTIPADGAALIHHLWAAPPALNTLAGGGIIVLAGTGLGDFYGWKASGSDFSPAPRGGWANYAINPAIGTPDYTVGTITTYNMIGMAVGATAQARGNPNACNAVRYGRCESIFTDGDIANGYATFDGYSLVDSDSANKWNLVDPVSGGYQIQGLVSLGTSGTSVDFREASVNISIINTINVTSAFNKIEVNNVASNIEWTAISITALGTVSIGSFTAIDNATITKDACTFTDMGTFTYLSNSTITNTIYRRCGLVSTGGGSFDGCTFDKATSTAANCADLADLTDCIFNSSGTGHAVELSSIGGGTMTWSNTDSDYAAIDGSTGNETIYVNVAAGSLIINVASGASTPTVRTAGATVSVVAGLSTISFDLSPLIVGYEWRIYTVTAKGSLVGAVEVAGEESAVASSQSYSYTHTGGVFYAIQFIPSAKIYKEEIKYVDSSANDQNLTFDLITDINN